MKGENGEGLCAGGREGPRWDLKDEWRTRNVHTSTWSRLKDAGGTLIESRIMAS